MSYTSITIQEVIDNINEKYYLPDIQREFVWKPEQVILLMDSILRGYPINSFLFWKIAKGNYDKWNIYKFIENFDPRKPHNEEQKNKGGKPELVLVLDGQQRLTSLLIALTGAYTIKQKYARKEKDESWSEKKLYINLLESVKKVQEDDDLETDVAYALRFLDPSDLEVERNRKKLSFWFCISEIMNPDFHKKTGAFQKFVDEKIKEVSHGNVSIFRHNIETLREAIWENKNITFYSETEQDSDRVLDIFARTNMGGTKHTKSDLLLSMVTSKWQINARKEINEFVDELNNRLQRDNDFNKDFVLKTSLVLTDISVRYRIETFTDVNLKQIENNWEAIKTAIKETVNLVNSFGIDRYNLTSVNAIIPIIYYLYKNPNLRLIGSTADDKTRNRMKIQQWLIMALINNVFSRQTDNVLANLRTVLQKTPKSELFPLEALNQALAEMKRGTTVQKTIEEILHTEYGDSEAMLALSLLYDPIDWGRATKYEKDHIFPQTVFDTEDLQQSGITDDSQIAKFQQSFNRLGNLQLITEADNREKSDTDFEKWLKDRDPDYRDEHLIPDDDNLLKLENFEQFLAAREELIKQRLVKLFS